MQAGVCEEVKPFNFYSLEEFEYRQLISRSKHFVGLFLHLETKLPFVVKELPYNPKTVETLTHVHMLKDSAIATIQGACLFRAKIGWQEARLRSSEEGREGREGK